MTASRPSEERPAPAPFTDAERVTELEAELSRVRRSLAGSEERPAPPEPRPITRDEMEHVHRIFEEAEERVRRIFAELDKAGLVR